MRNANIIGGEASLGFFIFGCAFFMVTFAPFAEFCGAGRKGIVYTVVKVLTGI